MSEYATSTAFLARLAACPGLAGVLAVCSLDPAWAHVYDPETGAWHVFPAVDLPPWVRARAQRYRPPRARTGHRRPYHRSPTCPRCHCHAPRLPLEVWGDDDADPL
jgi:hypothetical protein